MFYPRKIYPKILEHTQKSSITVLTGMRRTGKTYIVKRLLQDLSNKNSLYLDLERPDNRELFAEKNYDAIKEALVARGLSKNKTMIIALDEIQLSPEVPGAVKYLSDHLNMKFILTGSSSFYLKNLFSESLSGRKKIFELFPLQFGEFLDFKGIKYSQIDWQKNTFNHLEFTRLSSYYEEYLRFGGFPQVVLAESKEEKLDFLADIMSSYINIDVRSLADFSDVRNLYNLVKLLASRVGSRVEQSKLSRLTGLSRPTIISYLSFLEKTYLIKTIGVFTKSFDREIVKSRKVYFCDTGLANSLSELSGGAQFENTLFNQLTHHDEINYYALKGGQEIDFILGGKIAVEAKETPVFEDLSVLKRIAKTAGLSKSLLIGRHRSPKFNKYTWAGSII